MGFNFLIWVEIGRQGTLAAHYPSKGRVCRRLFWATRTARRFSPHDGDQE